MDFLCYESMRVISIFIVLNLVKESWLCFRFLFQETMLEIKMRLMQVLYIWHAISEDLSLSLWCPYLSLWSSRYPQSGSRTTCYSRTGDICWLALFSSQNHASGTWIPPMLLSFHFGQCSTSMIVGERVSQGSCEVYVQLVLPSRETSYPIKQEKENHLQKVPWNGTCSFPGGYDFGSGWWFQMFFFSPLFGEMIQFDDHIFNSVVQKTNQLGMIWSQNSIICFSQSSLEWAI